jgi:hypothetical protein
MTAGVSNNLPEKMTNGADGRKTDVGDQPSNVGKQEPMNKTYANAVRIVST